MRRHRGLKPESCHGTVKVKGLLDKNKPSNPTQGPRTAFDVGNTEKESKIEPREKSDDGESIH